MCKYFYNSYSLCPGIKINHFLILLFLTLFSNFALAFIDQTGEEVRLIWNRKSMLQAEELVFIDSFYDAYKDIPLKKLAIQDLFKFLQQAFNGERKDIMNNKNKILWVSAIKQKDHVVGYASFEIINHTKEIYIRQLAVKPEQMHRGIGKYLVFSIKNKYLQAKKLVVITRKVNIKAFDFYKNLGFKESHYMHAGYDSMYYGGLELLLN